MDTYVQLHYYVRKSPPSVPSAGLPSAPQSCSSPVEEIPFWSLVLVLVSLRQLPVMQPEHNETKDLSVKCFVQK